MGFANVIQRNGLLSKLNGIALSCDLRKFVKQIFTEHFLTLFFVATNHINKCKIFF